MHLNNHMLPSIFGGESRTGVVLGLPCRKKGYQLTMFYDPHSKAEWNPIGSLFATWLQASECMDQPIHGPAVVFNELDGDLLDLGLADYEALVAMASEQEREADSTPKTTPRDWDD
eukprot:CAMPEP_0114558656 /NCGR_PEP_ID=MMETSP0114-20121206/10501_1 /TAXON_ID=31324 /ORGANISM="Goniomonas sp, Strain m" /LENGTH=115 /DNA_ID=CAMNT_0001744067 /DNA_START=137 /DNA_END=484 /DNA_ORIENTATION=+